MDKLFSGNFQIFCDFHPSQLHPLKPKGINYRIDCFFDDINWHNHQRTSTMGLFQIVKIHWKPWMMIVLGCEARWNPVTSAIRIPRNGPGRKPPLGVSNFASRCIFWPNHFWRVADSCSPLFDDDKIKWSYLGTSTDQPHNMCNSKKLRPSKKNITKYPRVVVHVPRQSWSAYARSSLVGNIGSESHLGWKKLHHLSW